MGYDLYAPNLEGGPAPTRGGRSFCPACPTLSVIARAEGEAEGVSEAAHPGAQHLHEPPLTRPGRL